MTSHAIEPMRRPWAEAVSVWRYGGAYEMYSMDGSEACVQELLDGGYYAWLNKEGRPEGYFCFGPPAQIPTREEGVYPAGPLDIGLGMAPELCGTGKGNPGLPAGGLRGGPGGCSQKERHGLHRHGPPGGGVRPC